jgi:hypothetical protein
VSPLDEFQARWNYKGACSEPSFGRENRFSYRYSRDISSTTAVPEIPGWGAQPDLKTSPDVRLKDSQNDREKEKHLVATSRAERGIARPI